MSLWHHVCEGLTHVSSVWCHCDFKIWHHDEFINLNSWRPHIFDIINVSCSWCHYYIMFVRTFTLVTSVWFHCNLKIWYHDEFIYMNSWRPHTFDIINVSWSWCHYDIMFVRTSHVWVLYDVTVTLKYDITMSSFIWTHDDLTYLTSLMWALRDVIMTSCLWGYHTCEFCVMSLWL